MSSFKDYVTSAAFALTISKRQIECLCQLDQLGDSWMFLTTFRALEGKGLAERVKQDLDQHQGTYVRLTEAGRAVVPLLKLAGLYITYPKWPEPVELPPINVIVKRKPTPEQAEESP